MVRNMHDPQANILLDEVLDLLKHKNGQAQQVDGHISDFMNPNVDKIVKTLANEKERERKLDSSAVMPTSDIYKDAPPEPGNLLKLHNFYGAKNNKMVPATKNKFFLALTMQQQNERESEITSKHLPDSHNTS